MKSIIKLSGYFLLTVLLTGQIFTAGAEQILTPLRMVENHQEVTLISAHDGEITSTVQIEVNTNQSNLRGGSYSVICQNEDGNYNSSMEDYLYTPEIELPSGSSVVADFMVRGLLIDFDIFPEVDYWGVEVTPDGGETWYPVSNPYGDPDGTWYVYTDTPDIWGSFNDLFTTPIVIDDYAGLTVQFRMYLHSDGDDVPDEAEGLFIDDFVVEVDGTEVFNADFEDDTMGDWVSVDATATDPVWHQTTYGAYEGQSFRMADPDVGPNGGYLDHWYQVLETPSIDLPDAGDMELTFMQKRQIEGLCTAGCPTCTGGGTFDGWDAFNVRISSDGGSTWEVLQASDYNTDITYSFGYEFEEGCDIPGWGGPESGGSWQETSISIPSSYNGQSVIIRFAFASDPAYNTTNNSNLTGVWIDNINVADVFTSDAEDATEFVAKSLVTLGGDIWHVAYTAEEVQYPAPTNLSAQPDDGLVTLTWDAVGGVEGEIAFDNDNFTNGIFTTGGTFVAGELFNTLFGAAVTEVKVFGFDGTGVVDGNTTKIYGYNAIGGSVDSSPTYEKSIQLTIGAWNTVDLSNDGWIFSNEFVIGLEGGTLEDESIIYAALDESAAPSTNSYVNLGGWDTWQNVAESNNLPDGEWGIRATVEPLGDVTVVYDVYRTESGIDFGPEPLWYGDNWPATVFEDPMVTNGTNYCYAVKAVYNPGNDEQVSSLSDSACVTPEAQTTYEIAYDDGTAETSVTFLGTGGMYSVKMTPNDYPVQILKIRYYATNTGTGLHNLFVWDDDGANGMPGTQLNTNLLFATIEEGWNEKDVSANNIVISEGSFYVGWEEVISASQLGLDEDLPVDGNSYYKFSGGDWASISDLGYNGDIMIRAKVDWLMSADENVDGQIPSKFSLSQNYPNPFNPITQISFTLPENQKVKLSVFDMTGREIAILINKHLEAGNYAYSFDGRDHSSGVYFYRLETESFASTKKMILLK